jgi:hypothetical protein
MRLEAHSRFGPPVVIEVTRLVIRDEHGNTVALAVQMDAGWVFVSHAGDPEFNHALATMGLDRAEVVTANPATLLKELPR